MIRYTSATVIFMVTATSANTNHLADIQSPAHECISGQMRSFTPTSVGVSRNQPPNLQRWAADYSGVTRNQCVYVAVASGALSDASGVTVTV